VDAESDVRDFFARLFGVLPKAAPTFLVHNTGHDDVWWLRRVQRCIGHASTPPPKGDVHGRTDVKTWVAELAMNVERAMPKHGTYDGNMRMAAVLGHVLCLWYLRVHRSKSYDARRPVKLRRRATAQWLFFTTELMRIALDERPDAKVFPGQDWDPPWNPRAINGKFV